MKFLITTMTLQMLPLVSKSTVFTRYTELLHSYTPILSLAPKQWYRYIEKIAELCLFEANSPKDFLLLRTRCTEFFVQHARKEVVLPNISYGSLNGKR